MIRGFVAIIACAALVMAMPQRSVDEVVPEVDVSLFSDDELLEAQAKAQAVSMAEEKAQAKATAKEAVEVSAMDELKAYCQVAAQSKFFQNTNDKHRNALMHVIAEYSKKPGSNKHLAGGSSNNIVTQYGLMMGNLEGKARGMYTYILHALDDAILLGKSPFTFEMKGEVKPKKYVVFDSKMLGFQTTPDYFFKFDVTPDAWNAAKAAIPKGQTAKAIAAKLMKDKKSFYKKALSELKAVLKAKQKKAYDAAVRDSHKAIHNALIDAPDSLDNQEVLHPMGAGGLKAAYANKEYQNMPQPSMAELSKKALKKARAKVRAEAAKANAARLTKETEEKARLAAIEKKGKENAWKASTKAPTPPPTPVPRRRRYTATVEVGSQSGSCWKSFHYPHVHVTGERCSCPGRLTKSNWYMTGRAHATCGDIFDVHGSSVKRVDSRGTDCHGWGMQLRFKCTCHRI